MFTRILLSSRRPLLTGLNLSHTASGEGISFSNFVLADQLHRQAPPERQDTSIAREVYEIVGPQKRGLKDRPDLWIFNPGESYSYQQRTFLVMWINKSWEMDYLSVLQTSVIWGICRHSPCGLCWYLIAPSELSGRWIQSKGRNKMHDLL